MEGIHGLIASSYRYSDELFSHSAGVVPFRDKISANNEYWVQQSAEGIMIQCLMHCGTSGGEVAAQPNFMFCLSQSTSYET